MSERVRLKSADGFELNAYLARPTGKPKGAMVVVQEIFGVNSHIRSVGDLYAAEGYLTIAPEMFDRVQPDFEVGYGPDDAQNGFAIVQKLSRENALLDLSAAIAFVASAGKVGMVGYCWGGTMAYASACQLEGLAAAVGYYGGGVIAMKDQKPKIPTLLHFGELDKHIPVEGVNQVIAAQPTVEIHLYHADHGFNCDQRASYNKPSADLARERTFAFFNKHLAD
jgi:carboxymethylenebutenolidase